MRSWAQYQYASLVRLGNSNNILIWETIKRYYDEFGELKSAEAQEAATLWEFLQKHCVGFSKN